MTRIIVTDLTRFNNQDIVCTAGIDVQAKRCIRPMPYLKASDCKRLNILPGAVLSGNFSPPLQLNGPHQEDMEYKDLKFEGPCTSEEFRAALEVSLFPSVGMGFEIDLAENQKFVPLTHPVARSIVTIRVEPDQLEIVEDAYKAGKVKVIFADQSGHRFRYLPITDLGFHLFAERHHKSNKLAELNAFIKSQSLLYVRLGLSRRWNNGTNDAYWMQANGIYTFPHYHNEIRSYT